MPDNVARRTLEQNGLLSSSDPLPSVAVEVPLGGEALDLPSTFGCGQAFRWWPIDDLGTWEGVASGRVWQIRVSDDRLIARVWTESDPDRATRWLRHYFALETPLAPIHAAIAAGHPSGAIAVERYPGLRVLRQEPAETFLSFAVASAINVPRLQRCLAALARRHGQPIPGPAGRTDYSFPAPGAILRASLADLAGFCNLAYRARHLQGAAATLIERGAGWLAVLATLPYSVAHAALDDLPMIGPKIADCICLFGLGFDEAVPIDTHVWAISHEIFVTDLPRTLSGRNYRIIADRWRERFGPAAGWAQQYLFQLRRDQPIGARFRPGRA